MFVAAGDNDVDMLNMLIGAGGDVSIGDLVSLYTIHLTGYFSN